MTTPNVTPSKAKAWWALLVPQIPAIISFLLQASNSIPAPYGAYFAGVLSLVGFVSGAIVHQVKYLPPETAIVPTKPVVPPSGRRPNPFRPSP